jgi:hypothetical protein
MTMPAPISYEVTAITPDQQFGPNATPIPGKTITFSTTTGYTGTLFVPSSVMGDVPTVQALIEDEVRQVAAAQAIRGTVAGG